MIVKKYNNYFFFTMMIFNNYTILREILKYLHNDNLNDTNMDLYTLWIMPELTENLTTFIRHEMHTNARFRYKVSLYWQLTDNQVDLLHDLLDWNVISITGDKNQLSEFTVDKYIDKLDHILLSTWGNVNFSLNFLLKHRDIIDFDLYIRWNYLDNVTIRQLFVRHKICISRNLLCRFQPLSSKSIDTLFSVDKLSFEIISIYQILTKATLLKYRHNLYWGWICVYQPLSTNTIEHFLPYISWSLICRYQKLDNYFLLKYHEQLDLNIIVRYQKLNIELLELISDKFELYHWNMICRYQKIDDKIYHRYIGKLNDKLLSRYQNLSINRKREIPQIKIDRYFDMCNRNICRVCCLEIVLTNLREIHDDNYNNEINENDIENNSSVYYRLFQQQANDKYNLLQEIKTTILLDVE